MGLHRAPPKLWPRLGGEEVRGPSSEAVYTGVADTAAVSIGAADSAVVETLMAPLVPGVQKPPRWVGKRFQDRFAAAPLVERVDGSYDSTNLFWITYAFI